MSVLQTGRPSDSRWEGMCSSCGLCCSDRRRVAAGVRVDLRRTCPYLDVREHRCRVYTRRFKVESRCRKVTMLHALFGRFMPLSCEYVRRFRRWIHE